MSDEETKPEVAAPPAPTVRGFTERDYIAWKHHPVTRFFMRYLMAYRANMIAGAIEAWEHHPLDSQTDNEMRGRAKTLAELADLPFEAIAMFYAQIDEEAKTKPTPANEDDADDEA